MIVPAFAVLLALIAAGIWGRTALRWTVVLVVFLAPARGGLLALAHEIGISSPGLAVNALVPALIAAITLGVIWKVRPALKDLPQPLLIGWCVIAFISITNLAFQTVGLQLYAIGLAQYLVYPTLALAAWPLLGPGDLRLGVRVLIAAGSVVALTVMTQAAGIESFIQAATAQVDGFAAGRYAGVTGSYLHTSAFLGTCSVLAMGELLAADTRKRQVIMGLILAGLLSGVNLTFSRSGVMIALIGAATLLLFAARGHRLKFAAVLVVPAAIALIIGTLGGVTPKEATDRVSSGLSPTKDQGNTMRGDAISQGIDRVKENSILTKVFGEGLAFTGNARQLTGGDVLAVESYYLKLLLETGIVGLIAIGSFLVYAFYRYVMLAISRLGRVAAAVGAAGVGLSLYNVIYPALETQILALTWWLLLMLCFWSYRDQSGPDGEGSPAVAEA
jgi:hypothetical protein